MTTPSTTTDERISDERLKLLINEYKYTTAGAALRELSQARASYSGENDEPGSPARTIVELRRHVVEYAGRLATAKSELSQARAALEEIEWEVEGEVDIVDFETPNLAMRVQRIARAALQDHGEKA